MEAGPTKPKKPKPSSNSPLKYAGLGLQLLLIIGVASWVGHRLDLYFNFEFPVFLLSLVLIAFGGVMFQVYKSSLND
jgi:Putative F0F1-ATPase subunit Ca2+/Mg2+ transporter